MTSMTSPTMSFLGCAADYHGGGIPTGLRATSGSKGSRAQLRAAELARSGARSERLPSLAVNADYGVIGTNPSQSHGTFSVTGTLRFPIWQGGRTGGDIEQADATLTQRRAELEDLKLQVEGDIRKVYLDLEAATSEVEVAQINARVAKETLDLTRQRVEAGVADSVELVQSQEALAGAELDYIDSVFAHNVAKTKPCSLHGPRSGKPAEVP